MKIKMEEYELKRCVDVLLEAEEIKKDEAKMEKIQPLLTKKKKELKGKISSIDDLRKKEQEVKEEY